MKFLLDMGLAAPTARFLRSMGHDAVHLREQQLQRLSDSLIVEKARIEERVILTHDLDFGRIVALSQANFPSVVTFRLTDMRRDNVHSHLRIIISRFSHELLDGALISVTDEAIRVRRLPIN